VKREADEDWGRRSYRNQ